VDVHAQEGIDSLCIQPVGLVKKDQSNRPVQIVRRFGLLKQIGAKDVE
jgi:hypothetical protein